MTKSKEDSWSLWFPRAIQAVGLGTFVEQVAVAHAGTDRPWVLLIAVAMMLGALGLQIFLRGVLRMGGEGG